MPRSGRRVTKIVQAFFLLVLCGQATGAFALADFEACEGSCPDDDPTGRCKAVGLCCFCCLNARPLLVMTGPPVPSQASSQAEAPAAETFSASPRAQDVFHVPKPLLA